MDSNEDARVGGRLIVNADDWGRDRETTDRTYECLCRSTVSSVSGMVFMEDSERSAAIAEEQGIDVGLHLNLTTRFTGTGASAKLREHQEAVARFLRGYRLAPVVFHPGLARSFEYVVMAQREEFVRLFGREAERLDGHHHMHLCSNVVLGGLLPHGTRVRRNFSFQCGEKGFWNIQYRWVADRVLSRCHTLTDFFFSLPPLEPTSRLQKIFSLARDFVVEVETHPVNPEEYRFLTAGEICNLASGGRVAPSFAVGSVERRVMKRAAETLDGQAQISTPTSALPN